MQWMLPDICYEIGQLLILHGRMQIAIEKKGLVLDLN